MIKFLFAETTPILIKILMMALICILVLTIIFSLLIVSDYKIDMKYCEPEAKISFFKYIKIKDFYKYNNDIYLDKQILQYYEKHEKYIGLWFDSDFKAKNIDTLELKYQYDENIYNIYSKIVYCIQSNKEMPSDLIAESKKIFKYHHEQYETIKDAIFSIKMPIEFVMNSEGQFKKEYDTFEMNVKHLNYIFDSYGLEIKKIPKLFLTHTY